MSAVASQQPQQPSRHHPLGDENEPMAEIRRGEVPKEDSFPAPSSDWHWGEGVHFVIMSDYALAASLAIHAIFDDVALSVYICMCSVHAWQLWADSSKHRAYFNNYKKNRSKMSQDFEQYKRVPHVSLVVAA
jgi:hypothetical protein